VSDRSWALLSFRSSKQLATRLLHAKNEAAILVGSNLLVARTYMMVTDPHMPKRKWEEVVDFIIDEEDEANRRRWVNVKKDKALAPLWKLRVVETRAEQLLTTMRNPCSSVFIPHSFHFGAASRG